MAVYCQWRSLPVCLNAILYLVSHFLPNMAHHVTAVLSIAFVLYSVHVAFGAPGSNVNNFNNEGIMVQFVSDNDPEMNSFQISSITFNNKNRCTQQVTVSGKGVLDTFDMKCQRFFRDSILGTEKFAVYRNPQAPLTFFTNTPNTLIIFEGDKCTKRTYKTTKGRTTYSTTTMTTNECNKAKKDMEESEKEWQRDFEENMRKTFPPCFPFCNLQTEDIDNDDDDDDSQYQHGNPHKNQFDSDENVDDWDYDEDYDDWNF